MDCIRTVCEITTIEIEGESMKLIKEYEDEIERTKEIMLKAQTFAEKLPVFSKQIIEGKITGESYWIDFGKSYKKLYLGWGIKRGYYKNGGDRQITNCRARYDGFYFSIYVNCYSLFDVHQDFGLVEATKKLDVFFFDYMNSTFYVTDENIEPLLETLNEWCIQAFEQLKQYRKKLEIENLEKQLSMLKAREATND